MYLKIAQIPSNWFYQNQNSISEIVLSFHINSLQCKQHEVKLQYSFQEKQSR